MQISQNGLELVTSFEGYHRALPNGDCTTYRCQIGKGMDDGKWTIGYGCTEGITEGLVWTKDQAMTAFRSELTKHEKAVERLTTVELNQNQFDALVSFSYNCGIGALTSSTLLKKANAGDYEGAGRAFAAWNKSRGIVVSGLVRRRQAEAALFCKPPEQSPEPDMPQTVDAPPVEPQGSRKIAVSNAGQTMAAAGALLVATPSVSEGFGYAERVASFVKSYGPEMAFAMLVLVAGAFATIKFFTRQDYAAGTYTPSGASK